MPPDGPIVQRQQALDALHEPLSVLRVEMANPRKPRIAAMLEIIAYGYGRMMDTLWQLPNWIVVTALVLGGLVAGMVAPILDRSLLALALGMAALCAASWSLWVVQQRRSRVVSPS